MVVGLKTLPQIENTTRIKENWEEGETGFSTTLKFQILVGQSKILSSMHQNNRLFIWSRAVSASVGWAVTRKLVPSMHISKFKMPYHISFSARNSFSLLLFLLDPYEKCYNVQCRVTNNPDKRMLGLGWGKQLKTVTKPNIWFWEDGKQNCHVHDWGRHSFTKKVFSKPRKIH